MQLPTVPFCHEHAELSCPRSNLLIPRLPVLACLGNSIRLSPFLGRTENGTMGVGDMRFAQDDN